MRAIAPKFVGRIWPTGRFGVSRLRETPFLSQFESQPETEETRWNSAAIAVHGVKACLEFEGKWESFINPDLSNVTKSPNRSRRGLKGISRYGRNLVESAAVLWERRFDKRNLSFGTVTLPPASPEVLKAVSQGWSGIVKVFVKNLRRGLARQGLPTSVFGVTEIQPRRFDSSGVPALHLHFVFVGRIESRTSWRVSRVDIRRWWTRAIASYYPAGTDFSSVENVQAIKKSVASYLGKYLSKGSDCIAKVIELGLEDWLPSAWFFMSHELRRYVLSRVRSGENVGELLNWLILNPLQGFLAWCKPILCKRSDGSEFSVGYAGRLTAHGLDKVVQFLL